MFLIKCDLIFNPYPERVCLFCVVFLVYHIHRLSSSLKWAGFLLHRSLPFTIQRMGSWKMCSNFSSFSENEKMFDPIRERKATYARVDSSAVLCAICRISRERIRFASAIFHFRLFRFSPPQLVAFGSQCSVLIYREKNPMPSIKNLSVL